MLEILGRVGAHADHVVEIVEKFDVPVGKRGFSLSESRCDIVGKRWGGKIDHKFLAEIERGCLRKRERRQRQSFIFLVETPIYFPLVTFVVKRKAGLHQSREIAPYRLGRNDM